MAGELIYDVMLRATAPPTGARADALRALAKRMHARGLAPSYGPGDHGNMSYRTPDGCVMTARETSKAALRREDLVAVVGCAPHDGRMRLRCRGRRLPSTDALLHWRLYALRPDVGAILHGHDDAVVRQAEGWGLPVTRVSARVNSHALVEDVCTLCGEADYVVLRDHGFLALGATLDAAWRRVRAWSERARRPRAQSSLDRPAPSR